MFFKTRLKIIRCWEKEEIDLTIGISYGDDLEKVKKVTMDSLVGMKGLSTVDDITFFYTEFGDSSINYVLRIWINSADQPEFLGASSEAIMRIKKAYDENDITIPFPIRTLDFGIKGGVPLDDVTLKTEK